MPLGATVTGLPALLIILVILLLLVVGAVTIIRGGVRGAKKVADKTISPRDGGGTP
jgi:uncharacterized membrane protein